MAAGDRGLPGHHHNAAAFLQAHLGGALKQVLGEPDRDTGARTQYVALQHGFSGRSMGALSVTANAIYRDPFGPLIPGVTFVAPDDIKALEAAVTESTAAVIAEPIQG